MVSLQDAFYAQSPSPLLNLWYTHVDRSHGDLLAIPLRTVHIKSLRNAREKAQNWRTTSLDSQNASFLSVSQACSAVSAWTRMNEPEIFARASASEECAV